MFEYDQKIVEALISQNHAFQRLYERHDRLKEEVRKAERGALPLDEHRLVAMKKEKLLTKDKMAAMIDDYRRDNAAA